MRCSISECREPAVGTVNIGLKETRRLCRRHFEIYLNREKSHAPVFRKASKILDDFADAP